VKQLLLPLVLLAAAYCHAAPILPEEAKNHIGESVAVSGLVEQVSVSKKGHAFLNFGGHYPNQIFTGYVPAQNVAKVGGVEVLRSLADSRVTITGKIELYKGKPEIVISSSRSRRCAWRAPTCRNPPNSPQPLMVIHASGRKCAGRKTAGG
jgi:hypothetical protein